MPADLFRHPSEPASHRSRRPRSSFVLSLTVHVTLVGVAIAVPLVATDVLPPVFRGGEVYHVTRLLPPAPPPPPAPRRARALTPPAGSRDAAPVVVPDGIRPETGIVAAEAIGVSDGVEGSVPGLDPGESIFTPVPPPPPPPERRVEPVRPGGQIRTPSRITYVAPAYPPLAVSARVEGVVVIEAILDADGRVSETRILRSIPLLDQAARDAVRQWRYTPTLLNGMPVPVILTVTVHFSLGR